MGLVSESVLRSVLRVLLCIDEHGEIVLTVEHDLFVLVSEIRGLWFRTMPLV